MIESEDDILIAIFLQDCYLIILESTPQNKLTFKKGFFVLLSY